MVIVRLTSPDAPGRSVFVSAGAFRARALRVLGYMTGTLLVLWLAALIAGAVGAGRLPAVPFPAVGALREAPAEQPATPPPSRRQATTPGTLMERGLAPAGSSRDRVSQRRLGTPAPAGLLGTGPRSGSRTGPGRDVGAPQPGSAGSAPPVQAAPAAGAQPQPSTPPAAGTTPGASAPAPAHPPAKGGGAPPADRPSTANGSAANPPASRPVDPPADGSSAAPPATRPVDPPAGAGSTADSPSTG